jgi:hypothetical protein
MSILASFVLDDSTFCKTNGRFLGDKVKNNADKTKKGCPRREPLKDCCRSTGCFCLG